MKKLIAHFKKLKENMQGMTFLEKVDHIWTYYKETMLVIFIVGVIIVGVVWSLVGERPTEYTCGIMSNAELSSEGHHYLTKVFLEDVLKKPEGRIFLRSSDLIEMEETVQAVQSKAQNVQSVLAQIEAKKIDYMLMDNYSVQYYVKENIYKDLSQILTKEELALLEQQDMLFSIREESEDVSHPVGINIAKMDFGKDCLNVEGPVYLVFIRNTDEKENCLKLWEHIKAWKSE